MTITQTMLGWVRRRPSLPKSPTAAQRRAARELLILQDDTGTGVRYLAVGLVWRPLLQANGARHAATMAKEARATHFTVLPTKVAGYGVLPKSFLKKNKGDVGAITPVASLAIGRVGATPALLAIDLGEGETWICVLRNQRPEGAEEILRNAVGDNKAVLQRLRELQSAPGNEDLQLYTDISNAKTTDSKALSLADLASQPVLPGSQLQLVGAGGGSGALPRPVMALGIVGAVAYLAYNQYTSFQAEELAAQKAAARALAEQSNNPAAAWKSALANLPNGRNEPSTAALTALRSNLASVPVDWLGWELKSLKCQAQSRKDTGQVWECLALYDPSPRGRRATNLELSRAVPAGMRVDFAPTTRASLAWSFDVETTPLETDALPTKQSVVLHTASRLQELRPVLSEAPVFVFSPLKGLVEPKTPGGQPIPKPPEISLPLEAALVVHGPLRSMQALSDRSIAADWKSLSVAVNRDSAAASATPLGDVSARSTEMQSLLMLTLEGTLYAQQ